MKSLKKFIQSENNKNENRVFTSREIERERERERMKHNENFSKKVHPSFVNGVLKH